MKKLSLLCALALFGTTTITLPSSKPSEPTKRLFKIVEENPWDLVSIKKALADNADVKWVDERGEGILHKYLKGINNTGMKRIPKKTLRTLIFAGANPFQKNTYKGYYSSGYGGDEKRCYGDRTTDSFFNLIVEEEISYRNLVKKWKDGNFFYAAEQKKYTDLIECTKEYLQELQEESQEEDDDDAQSEQTPQ